MSREIFGISTVFLGDDIKSFRGKLGLSRGKFARLLGCSDAAVSQWEREVRRPSEVAIEKMRQLARDQGIPEPFGGTSQISNLEPPAAARPTEETRPPTGPKAGISNSKSTPGRRPHMTPEQNERLRHFSDAMTGLQLVYEAAEAGHAAADEVLRDLANKLTVRGGDWRRMKYMHNLRKDGQE